MNAPVIPDAALLDVPVAGYRSCVAMVVVNREGMVLEGQRRGKFRNQWQFPQGGINTGEKPVAACLRELHEETGLRENDVKVLDHAPQWIKYDLPPPKRIRRNGESMYGQAQAWFLLQLVADLPEPGDLVEKATDDEFTDYRWAKPAEAIRDVVKFKRKVYVEALLHFANGHMSGCSHWDEVKTTGD